MLSLLLPVDRRSPPLIFTVPLSLVSSLTLSIFIPTLQALLHSILAVSGELPESSHRCLLLCQLHSFHIGASPCSSMSLHDRAVLRFKPTCINCTWRWIRSISHQRFSSRAFINFFVTSFLHILDRTTESTSETFDPHHPTPRVLVLCIVSDPSRLMTLVQLMLLLSWSKCAQVQLISHTPVSYYQSITSSTTSSS